MTAAKLLVVTKIGLLALCLAAMIGLVALGVPWGWALLAVAVIRLGL